MAHPRIENGVDEMKLYCVIGGWDYEGYSEPEGIFSSRERAEARAEELRNSVMIAKYNYVDVIEYELDVVGEVE
jgi:hypothetical protein